MPTSGRPDQQRVAELIGQGLSPALAKREERAERAGFRAEGATRAYSKYDQAARRRSAESKGYGGPGKARRAREAARAGDPSKLREPAPPKASGRRQVFATPAGTVIKTTPGGAGMHVLQRRIQNAPRGTRAKVLVTTADGRTLTLYGKGGISTAALRRKIEDEGGDLGDVIDSDIADVYGAGGGGAIVAVQVVIS